jgi:hypothetical protein
LIEFERHRPDNLPVQCKEWLIAASKRTGISYLDVDKIIASCLTRDVQIYSMEEAGVLKACFCLNFHNKTMNLLLLGGEDVKSWRDDLVRFLFATAKYEECTEFTMMGPLAWKRLFPEVTLRTCVFGRNLT